MFRHDKFDDICSKVDRRSHDMNLASITSELFKKLEATAKHDQVESSLNGEQHLRNGEDTVDGDVKSSDVDTSNNPFGELITLDSKRLPLFAMKFPELFVCS